MIYWNPNLLMDTDLIGKELVIARHILHGEWQKDIYCILLPQNPANLFEIMHVNELNFSYYRKRNMYIVGLAASRKKAIMLVCKMIADAYRSNDQPNIRGQFDNYDQWGMQPVHTI